MAGSNPASLITMKPLDYFLATYGLRETDVIFVPYGSRVYGTEKPWSDRDYMAIVPENRRADTGTEYRRGDTDIHIYNRWDFRRQLEKHKIHCLEAYFHPDGEVPKHFELSLNLEVLYDSLSRKSLQSFVRAKQKIRKENDLDLGRKSLFHSLRILDFGIQMAEKKRIVDYSSMNEVWIDLEQKYEYNWGLLEEEYKPVYNDLHARLREVTLNPTT